MAEPDVVYVSSIDWSFLWQVHQELAVRLARGGQRVFYIENTGVRTPGLADLPRVAARLGNWLAGAGHGGARDVPAAAPELRPATAAAIRVVAPLVLPPFGGTAARALNRRVLLPRLLHRLSATGLSRERLLWTFLPTDTALDLLAAARTERSLLVYYCLADFEQLAGDPARLRAAEDELVGRADLVFANSPLMAGRLGRLRPDVHLFPPGIDLSAFPARGAILEDGDRALLARLSRPTIGYVGGLHHFVDFALVLALARARPAWSFVLVGPRVCDDPALSALATLGNVHLVGRRRHDRLAGLIEACDVCLLPYRVTPATKSVMPVKVNEYLAMGRPVVATGLPPMRALSSRGVLTTAAPEPGAFLAAIEDALAGAGGAAGAARRRAEAEALDWDVQFARMQALIAEAWLRRGGPARQP